MSKNQYLTPTQQDVKKAKPVRYGGPDKNTEPEVGCDIITLYVTCKLGYSPIRHIIGHTSDHKVEDVVRQHMLGRKDICWDKGELLCPSSKTISDDVVPIIRSIVHKYGTLSDPYVADMFARGKWYDDPAYGKKTKVCSHCGKGLDDDWKLCPYCGHSKDEGKQKKLF